MATGYPEVEQQEGTRLEKFLLAALVAFLLVGGFWALSRIEDRFPQPVLRSYPADAYNGGTSEGRTLGVEDELGVTAIRNRLQQLQQVADNRHATLEKVRAAQRKADEDYKFRREEYRTAMQAGHASAAQRTAFESSRSAYQAATARIAPAQAESDAASKSLDSGQAELNAAAKRAEAVFDERTFHRNLKIFGYHFGYAGACLGLSWILWQLGRKKRWRYQTILSAFFISSILQLLFLLFRYCWELFLDDYALLGVSVLGAIVCILAIVGIKRWLFSPTRLALARLDSRRCPYCATSFAETQTHCWHCGQALREDCVSCGASRLILASHCGNCGATSQRESQH